MAQLNLLPEGVLGRLNEQLDALVESLGETKSSNTAHSGGSTELSDAVPIWLLPDEKLHAGTDESLEELASRTAHWHHPIRTGEVVNGFARSESPGHDAQDWELTELSRSEFAARLATAYSQIEGDAREVRLLVAPGFDLHAFWLIGEGNRQVLVADLPAEVAPLEPDRLYQESEFLDALRHGRPIVGIGDD